MTYDQAEYERAIRIGAGLISEHGENPEYDRGVSEVLGDLFPIIERPLDERRDDVLADMRAAQQAYRQEAEARRKETERR